MSDFPQFETESLDTCPMARAVRLIGDMWTLLIVRSLLNGSRRFTELQDDLGSVSSGTLSQRLKVLEAAELLERHAFAEIPPRVEYELTPKGRALVKVMMALREYGSQYLCDSDDAL